MLSTYFESKESITKISSQKRNRKEPAQAIVSLVDLNRMHPHTKKVNANSMQCNDANGSNRVISTYDESDQPAPNIYSAEVFSDLNYELNHLITDAEYSGSDMETGTETFRKPKKTAKVRYESQQSVDELKNKYDVLNPDENTDRTRNGMSSSPKPPVLYTVYKG